MSVSVASEDGVLTQLTILTGIYSDCDHDELVVLKWLSCLIFPLRFENHKTACNLDKSTYHFCAYKKFNFFTPLYHWNRGPRKLHNDKIRSQSGRGLVVKRGAYKTRSQNAVLARCCYPIRQCEHEFGKHLRKR